jgi:hypothetical protein
MKYVLDSNVALKWVLHEPDSDKARQVRVNCQQQFHELLTPDIFPIEAAPWLGLTGQDIDAPSILWLQAMELLW